MGRSVTATVPTVEAKPHTMAGILVSSLAPEACTTASDAIAMPVRLLSTDRSRPPTPPPRMKKDAKARKTTQTGTSMTFAVNSTASAPGTPILTANAFFSDTRSPRDWSCGIPERSDAAPWIGIDAGHERLPGYDANMTAAIPADKMPTDSDIGGLRHPNGGTRDPSGVDLDCFP
jgi:hypothetical protein